MTALVLLDAEVIAGPLRLTTVSNEVTMDIEAEELDTTVFGLGGWKRKKAGLKTGTIESQGFWDTGTQYEGALGVDAELWGQHGSEVPVIVSPTGNDLAVAYIANTVRGNIAMWDKVGTVAPYSSSMRVSGLVARGAMLHRASTTETVTGTGSAFVLGTVAADEKLYLSLNALAIAGTSPQLTIVVERDDNAGFASPTTVATLGPVAVPTAELTVVVGPVTPDDHYRARWTLSGTGPSARFAVAVGKA